MPTPLGDIEARVNVSARTLLTHAITINGKPLRAQGDYGDGEIVGLGSAGSHAEIEVMVLKADWPAEPLRSDIVTSAKKPGLRFRPANVATSEDGAHWIFNLIRLGA
jgi:hypothetical protein